MAGLTALASLAPYPSRAIAAPYSMDAAFRLRRLDPTWLWRVGFGVAGLLGVIEAVTILASRPTSGAAGGTRGVTASHVVTLVLYALVVVVAAWIGLPKALGLDLRSLVIEGILVTLILLLGVNLAWRYFVETAPPVRPDGGTSTPA